MANKAISLEQMSRIWGKVKNYVAASISGLYAKPSGGIPKSDLSSDVQTSLGKADTALQTHQDISGKQDVISDLSTIRSGAAAGATALQPNDLADWAKQPTRPSYTANDTGALPNTTTIADLEDATHKTVTPTEKETWNGKQDLLVSGTNIKTIAGQSLLGGGNIPIDMPNTVYGIRGTLFSPTAKGKIYNRSILFQYSDTELVGSATSYANNDNKTLTTLDFNPFGTIAYANNLSADDGASLNSSSIFYQVGVDLRYGFNIVANPLVAGKVVYIKCEPIVDGSNNRTGRVRLASVQPIVQDLPTSQDGYVYIQLGWATTTTGVFVILSHPIYEYRNNGIKLWIGD